MEATKILVSTTKTEVAQASSDACLVHIYPTGPTMGTRFPLGNSPLTVGRDTDCPIHLNDESVSRRHACIQPQDDDYCILDLQSTNGTYVNEMRITSQKLHDGDYLHIGNCICRFLAGGNVEAQYHEEIYRLTIIDALTDIFNRRHLLESLSQELASASRYQHPLALILFDVDMFRLVNERLGHLGGDFTLRELAGCVKKVIRQPDIFARYGGEEFAIIMPDTGREEALVSAERIRQLVAVHPFRYESYPYQVTISLGVGASTGADWMTTREIIQQADTHLRQAKLEGRNRVGG